MKKIFTGHTFSKKIAQKTKIISHKTGSIFDEIHNTVAIAIAKPKSESCRMSFQFIRDDIVHCIIMKRIYGVKKTTPENLSDSFAGIIFKSGDLSKKAVLENLSCKK